MKRKARKLHLNRETVRNLSNSELSDVAGGIVTYINCSSQALNCTDPACVATGRSMCIACPTDGPGPSCAAC